MATETATGTFSDDDLKRLKDEIKYCFEWHNHGSCTIPQHVNRLIARLEAAEHACRASEDRLKEWTRETYVALDNALRAWRKAAGK